MHSFHYMLPLLTERIVFFIICVGWHRLTLPCLNTNDTSVEGEIINRSVAFPATVWFTTANFIYLAIYFGHISFYINSMHDKNARDRWMCRITKQTKNFVDVSFFPPFICITHKYWIFLFWYELRFIIHNWAIDLETEMLTMITNTKNKHCLFSFCICYTSNTERKKWLQSERECVNTSAKSPPYGMD